MPMPPPPADWLALPETVSLISVTAFGFERYRPPPCPRTARFPATVVFWIVTKPPAYTPPPLAAVLSIIVHPSIRLADDPLTQSPPPMPERVEFRATTQPIAVSVLAVIAPLPLRPTLSVKTHRSTVTVIPPTAPVP